MASSDGGDGPLPGQPESDCTDATIHLVNSSLNFLLPSGFHVGGRVNLIEKDPAKKLLRKFRTLVAGKREGGRS